MGPKHGLKFNEGRRCKYVESERDQSNRWFFSRSGWRCCFTGDQHSGCHDREREFSQFPSGHGGAENGNRDILGAHRRGARWKQESHRTKNKQRATTKWTYLSPNPKSSYKQLFVKGTRIRARVL